MNEYITFAQAQKLALAIHEANLDLASILKELGVSAIVLLPASKFSDATALIDEATGKDSSWV